MILIINLCNPYTNSTDDDDIIYALIIPCSIRKMKYIGHVDD